MDQQEVLTMSQMQELFNIEKVGKSGVKFDEKKLEFFNQMHIRDKFASADSVDLWRQTMLDTMPEKLHTQIRDLSDAKMIKIKDMMKTRIHFYHDLNNHTYFFE